jgi:hypothetical protein
LATPQTPDLDAVQANLQYELREGGRLAFDAPDNMLQGQREKVVVRIAFNDIGPKLTEGLNENKNTKTEEIQVSPSMKAVLFSDDDAFSVTTASSEEQLVIGRPFAQWEWFIRAKKSGEHTLRLRIVAVVHTNDRGDKLMDMPVAERSIKIKVSYKYLLWEFFGDSSNWKYLIGSTSLLAMLAAAGRFIRNRIKRNKGSGDPPTGDKLENGQINARSL